MQKTYRKESSSSNTYKQHVIRQPTRYNAIGQSTKKQVQCGKLRKTPTERMVFVHLTTETLFKRSITSIHLLIENQVIYYVQGNATEIYPRSVSYDVMKQILVDVFKEMSFISFQLSFTLDAIQKYFQIDPALIKQAEKHQLLNLLRQGQQQCTKQKTINDLGLANDSIRLLNASKISKLWTKRFENQSCVSLILAWSMQSVLAIKYMTFYVLRKYKQLRLLPYPRWQQLETLKAENAKKMKIFEYNELNIDLNSQECQQIISSL